MAKVLVALSAKPTLPLGIVDGETEVPGGERLTEHREPVVWDRHPGLPSSSSMHLPGAIFPP